MTSVNRILHDAVHVFKMSSLSRSVSFMDATATSGVQYAHAYEQLAEKCRRSEHLGLIMFGNETTFSLNTVPAMFWAKKRFPASIRGDNGMKGVFTLIVLNAAGSVLFVSGNIEWSHASKAKTLLHEQIATFDKHNGQSADLLIINNASWHHKALTLIATSFIGYPPANELQSSVWNSKVSAECLNADIQNGSAVKVQVDVLSSSSGVGKGNGWFVPTRPAGMVLFQPCKILFKSLKVHMERLPADICTKNSLAIEHLV